MIDQFWSFAKKRNELSCIPATEERNRRKRNASRKWHAALSCSPWKRQAYNDKKRRQALARKIRKGSLPIFAVRVPTEQPELFYDPQPIGNGGSAVIRVDDVDYDCEVNTATHSGNTKRHNPSADLIHALDPIVINPDNGHIQEVHFPNGNTAIVMFAEDGTSCTALQRCFDVYESTRNDIDTLLGESTTSFWKTNDLAGGCVLPIGCAGMPSSPQVCKDSEEGHMWAAGRRHVRPCIRRTILDGAAQRLAPTTAQMQGSAAALMKKYFEAEYEWNHLIDGLSNFSDDVCFPPIEEQKRVTEDGSHWLSHQMLFRKVTNNENDRNKVAMHIDKSDGPGKQLCQYYPMGGDDGCGGKLRGTNLLIWEHEKGGRCISIPTMLHERPVAIAFDGSKQLHATDGCFDRSNSNSFWSCRCIPYFRGPITNYVKDGRDGRYGKRPLAFVDEGLKHLLHPGN